MQSVFATETALLRGLSTALLSTFGALSTLCAVLTSGAWAQGTAPDLFTPALTDPNSAWRSSMPPDNERFSRSPDRPMRATQPATAALGGASAGATGFDATGSIAKGRKGIRRPGSPFPLRRAGAVLLDPSQTTKGASAPQIAVRNAYANVYKPPDAPVRRRPPPDPDPFGPVGVRIGSFLLRPALEVGYGVDSNPNRTSGGPRSNFAQLLPELLTCH